MMKCQYDFKALVQSECKYRGTMPDLNYKESNRRIVFGILDHLWRHLEEMHPLENARLPEYKF